MIINMNKDEKYVPTELSNIHHTVRVNEAHYS